MLPRCAQWETNRTSLPTSIVLGDDKKGSPISKAPVKRAHLPLPSVCCQRGVVSHNNLLPHHRHHVTASHPGGLRQCVSSHLSRTSHPSGSRQRSEPPRGSAPAPGTACPRPPSVPGRVPCMHAQDVELPAAGANPVLAHDRGVSAPTRWRGRKRGGACGSSGVRGRAPTPLRALRPTPHSCTISRRRGSGRTGPARATCDNTPARGYAPRLSVPPADVSGPASVDSTSESRPRSEWRSGRLQ